MPSSGSSIPAPELPSPIEYFSFCRGGYKRYAGRLLPMAPDPYANAPRLPDQDSIEPRALFGWAPTRVELEIGPGRGWFLVERLESEPGICMLGLEIRRKWASIVDDRLRGRGLGDRGRVFAEDARVVLPKFVPASVDAVFVHFPDPWWKKRHAKRRLVTDAFLRELSRVLVAGGELFIQTDVTERAEQVVSLVDAEHAFEPWGASARLEESPYVAKSPRERRALEDGLPVVRLRYRRVRGAALP